MSYPAELRDFRLPVLIGVTSPVTSLDSASAITRSPVLRGVLVAQCRTRGEAPEAGHQLGKGGACGRGAHGASVALEPQVGPSSLLPGRVVHPVEQPLTRNTEE